ncbi:MAG TPA: hypothetical protein VFQ35_14145, partial [Polyangiaceae bacterium]|nr:hypothetical protein [Polyangiaceae bacterium]
MRNFARTSSLAVLVAGATAAAHRAHAAEPTVSECLGANEKSIALRRESKLEAAREQLLVCAAASCPAEIRKECADRVERVNAAIPTIVFEVKDAVGIDVVAVHLTVDGRPATDVKEGVALPLDPGTHTFQFEANGYLRSEKTLVLRQGEKDRRELITLAREPVKEARAATVPAALA